MSNKPESSNNVKMDGNSIYIDGVEIKNLISAYIEPVLIDYSEGGITMKRIPTKEQRVTIVFNVKP